MHDPQLMHDITLMVKELLEKERKADQEAQRQQRQAE